MIQPLQLKSIPDNIYPDYKTEVIFNAYKWDPQINDQNTVAKYILVINKETADQLGQWAEQLAMETMLMEEAFLKQLPLAKELGLPSSIIKTLPRLSNYNRELNVRLKRFDFHPAENSTAGWAVSEVNSDVPGGLAEASALPLIAKRYVNAVPGENVASYLFKSFQSKIKSNGTIAFIHATSYSDDRQVMQFLGDYFENNGVKSIYAAPDHIKWIDKKAFCITKEKECPIDGIIRFFPLEWLENLPKQTFWQGYYDCQTPSCNSPVSIFAQSKRLPLVWDKLGVDIPAWKQLLPQTICPKSKQVQEEDWIYKPALGRVGEGISIKEAIPEKELKQIHKAVKKEPRDWIKQKYFKSKPVTSENGDNYHLCIGVFTVDGKNAGFYGRISLYPRIDSNAIDIPILIAKEGD